MDFDSLERSIRDRLDGIGADLTAYRAAQAATPATWKVKAGDNLQAALDQGGAIQLEAGATFEGQAFTFHTPGTLVLGQGATLRTTVGPALFVPPGAFGITASDLVCTCDLKTEAPVRLGAADGTQMRLDQVPHTIVLTRVTVPTHRGKRGFSFHSTLTDILDCEGHDIWTPGQDSQPWWIHNTPGKIRILGGKWSAGSELGLFGGAPFNIPGLVPTGVEVAHGHYFRPPEWQTDDVDREVKNGLEVKNGRDLHFHHLLIEGCFQWAQPRPAAFMLTPTQGGECVNIRVEDIELRRCADLLVATGRDVSGINQTQTTGIAVTRVRGQLTREGPKGGGSGMWLLAQRNVGTVSFEDCVVDSFGLKLAEFVDATGKLTLRGCTARVGKYGVTCGGSHASTSALFLPNGELELVDNTFGGPGATTRFRTLFPGNTYVDDAELALRFQGLL
jgi:hypothetical protein